jgi:hypothetical protein
MYLVGALTPMKKFSEAVDRGVNGLSFFSRYSSPPLLPSSQPTLRFRASLRNASTCDAFLHPPRLAREDFPNQASNSVDHSFFSRFSKASFDLRNDELLQRSEDEFIPSLIVYESIFFEWLVVS